jgi:hypothetical protein
MSNGEGADRTADRRTRADHRVPRELVISGAMRNASSRPVFSAAILCRPGCLGRTPPRAARCRWLLTAQHSRAAEAHRKRVGAAPVTVTTGSWPTLVPDNSRLVLRGSPAPSDRRGGALSPQSGTHHGRTTGCRPGDGPAQELADATSRSDSPTAWSRVADGRISLPPRGHRRLLRRPARRGAEDRLAPRSTELFLSDAPGVALKNKPT